MKTPRSLVLAVAASFLTAQAWASDAASPVAPAGDGAQDSQVAGIDSVVVTGARVRDRIVKDSPAPIDVVSGKELLATGQGDLLSALQQLLPSFNSSAKQSDLEGNIPGASLRNLSPGYTLVLINGKRRNTSAYTSVGTFAGESYTDLSLIPVSAIDHIEVLRDGASAIYGSDAIAGVFNIILKSSPKDGSIGVEWGQSYAGDGARKALHFNKGFAVGDDKGFLNLSADLTDQGNAIRSLTYRSTYLIYPAIGPYGQLEKLGSNNSLPPGDTPNPAEATRDNNLQANQGTNAFDTRALALNFGYRLNDAVDFYGFGTYSSSDKSALQNPRLPITIWQQDPSLLQLYPNGFTPTEDTAETDYSLVGGLKGVIAGWTYDASAAWNRDYFDIFTRNSANLSLQYPTGAPLYSAVSPPPPYPTSFYDGRLDYQQWIGNLDFMRAFDAPAFAAPLQVSFGAEYQHEQYRRLAGDIDGYFGSGAEAYPANKPADQADESRHREAAYIGASTNIIKPWLVDLAGRFEDHSDVGTVYTGRFSTRFEFSRFFAVRGTVSNGFKAPGLATEDLQITKVLPGQQQLTAAVNSAAARALGSSPLVPERSRDYSVGFTFNPARSFNAALDLYQITITDQLGRSANLGYNYSAGAGQPVTDSVGTTLTAAQQAVYDRLLATAGVVIQPGENYSVNYYTNIGDTKTSGVELTLESQHDLGRAGTLRWTYALSYHKTEILGLAPVPAVLLGLPDITGLTSGVAYNLEHTLPELTHIASVFWNNGPWNASLNIVGNGNIPHAPSSTIKYYDTAAAYVANVTAGYAFQSGLSAEIGASNVLDKYPGRIPAAALTASANAQFLWQYTSGTLDREGGFYFVRVSYRL